MTYDGSLPCSMERKRDSSRSGTKTEVKSTKLGKAPLAPRVPPKNRDEEKTQHLEKIEESICVRKAPNHSKSASITNDKTPPIAPGRLAERRKERERKKSNIM